MRPAVRFFYFLVSILMFWTGGYDINYSRTQGLPSAAEWDIFILGTIVIVWGIDWLTRAYVGEDRYSACRRSKP